MNFKKIINKTGLCFVFLLTLSIFILSGVHTTKAFAFSGNGAGTTADPYIITTAEQLSSISSNLTASYKLANDINLENIDFVPIGNKATPFIGTFDGNGHNIRNLKINQPSRGYVGLFGMTNNATVKNLSIIDAKIIGKDYTGGLAGCSIDNSTILNCSVTGSSTITGSMHTGGLVGSACGLIKKCFTTTDIASNNSNVGGLVGSANIVSIDECFTTGNVKASCMVGGLVGGNLPNKTALTMHNCYSLCKVEATDSVNSMAGGLIGSTTDDIIDTSYFAGTINGVELNKGALIGYTNSYTSGIKNVFYDGVRSGLMPKKSYEMSSRLTSAMTRKQSYPDWNFDSIWTIDENTSYPYLKNLTKPSGVNVILPLTDITSGTGSVNDPYIISTKEQLNNVKFDLTANYKLANDINLESMDFVPIGSHEEPFIGTFDGNGYTIQNLKINQPSRSYVGLFSQINNATLKNLNIVDAKILGKDYTGGLAGFSNGHSTISNCSVTGSSTITGSMHTGGLVGYASGLITKCFTTTDVISKNSHVGGLVGSANTVEITECFTTGNVKASCMVGGLVGCNVLDRAGLVMQNCYSLCKIEATDSVNSMAGGLVGSTTNDVIDTSYFAGTVNGVELNKGGLIGYTNSSTSGIKNNFYDGVKSGLVPKKSYDMSSRLTSGMTRKQSYPDWNFDSIWAIDENTSYPYLKNLTKPSGVNVILPLTDVESGKGSLNDPYIIKTKEQLNNVKFDLTANYKLANDINLESIDFVPIGSHEAPFIGTFDGNGYTIQNLKIDKPSRSYVGLFGQINNATLKNLNIFNAKIIGKDYTGVLAGCSNSHSTISNCSVTGSYPITGSMHTGGLVGYASGLITKCFTTTDVISKNSHVGGLVGSANTVEITECFTTGNVKASCMVGGLVGCNVLDKTGLVMQNCYSLCKIEATDSVTSIAGGLVGSATDDIINYCYFAGTINGVQLYKGALIGYTNSSTSGIRNNFFDTDITGFKSPSNAAKTTTEMKKKGTFTGWDFTNIWSIDEGSTYPYFKRLATPLVPEPCVPDAPTDLGGYRDGGVSVSWNKVANATGYNVKRSLTPGGPYTNLLATPTNQCYFFDTTADYKTTYYYVVTAVNATGESSKSNETCFHGRDLTISKDENAVKLGWCTCSEDTSYSIKKSTVPNGPYTYIAKDVNINKTPDYINFVDNNVNSGTSYYYVVEMKISSGDIQNSGEISITP